MGSSVPDAPVIRVRQATFPTRRRRAAWGAPLGEFPESGFDKVMNVNVKGVFMLTRALVPMLTAGASDDDPARVINTGSIDGIVPPGRGRDNFSYSASKAAVHMLTQHLAGELAPRILVNAIAPGLFESRMTKELLAYGSALDLAAREAGVKLPSRLPSMCGTMINTMAEATMM